MKININTKYNIGDTVYFFEKEISGCQFKGYIFKTTIKAIVINKDGTYTYSTTLALLEECELFSKLKDAKQWVTDQDYIVGSKWGCVKCIS